MTPGGLLPEFFGAELFADEGLSLELFADAGLSSEPFARAGFSLEPFAAAGFFSDFSESLPGLAWRWEPSTPRGGRDDLLSGPGLSDDFASREPPSPSGVSVVRHSRRGVQRVPREDAGQ